MQSEPSTTLPADGRWKEIEMEMMRDGYGTVLMNYNKILCQPILLLCAKPYRGFETMKSGDKGVENGEIGKIGGW